MTVARVALDQPLSHLDRLFDYEVPEELRDAAVVGARVLVRFAGRRLDGWIVELVDESDVERLAPLLKVVSSEPVMRPGLVRLIRAVADHYAGTFSDVVRLAVPPRHARTENAAQRPWPEPTCDGPARVLPGYPTGESFLAALRRGDSPRAFWQVAAVAGGLGEWTAGIAEAVAATLQSERSALVLVPDERDLNRVHGALADRFGAASIGVLHSGLGPSRRYRNYLAATRGVAKVMVGTRGAVFAPLPDLGLIAMWDDGDDLYSDPQAPYPHAREVAAIRTVQQGNALLLAAHARTAEAQAWLERGWLRPIELPPAATRGITPVVRVTGDSQAELRRDPLARRVRLPARAFDTLRVGLTQGPVLVQVPRAGYLVSLSCDRCRERARCEACSGPLLRPDASAPPQCRWCGRLHPGWSCSSCGSTRLRAPMVGVERTAEELARAFPGVASINSSGDRAQVDVPDKPAIVVATPGAEPSAPSGYAAALLLDTEALLQRPSLRVAEEALRRWFNAVGLVRPASDGGTVVAVGDPGALQALVRLDPAEAARRELADRIATGFPPAGKLIRVQGPLDALEGFLASADWSDVQRIGPAPHGSEWSLLLRAPLPEGPELTRRAKAALSQHTAHKRPGSLRIQVDPVEIG
ncbi:MAG: primosomal protein N' [Propionibacteriaceae bacterium]|nr:primosomal protein N' [Propionibacteriaceae bacterium]